MNFKDIGIIIAKKPLKENSSIITVFTENYGLYSGVIRETSRKSGSINQQGNIVDFFWQARLHEHIGMAKCELIKSYAGLLITNKIKLYAFNSIISLIKIAFHERENHNNFFPIFVKYLSSLANNFTFEEYVRLELAILQESGYGLELDKCALTGSQENLKYVSPKSGKAVCLSAGLAYQDRLLILPQFLTATKCEITNNDKKHAFELTSYFFNRYFFDKQQPLYAQNSQARDSFIECMLRI
ncbi:MULTISPECIES: DNA repair protein RecO [unclassified Candidatus Tisiphia]|uniref:DNA repair protein RecO n=1 Tax=unclassified Candidatus Tisiphia TaxID=2996318 RepID=UPI00312C7536